MMNKNLGSKKKYRHALFIDRKAKREQAKEKRRRYVEAINSDSMEEVASAMGIRLK